MIGRKFGRLTVLERAGTYVSPSGQKAPTVRARCDCGSEVVTVAHHLRTGRTKSCGCLKLENASKVNWKHGHARAGKVRPEHRIWLAMIRRCTEPSDPAFDNYGGRGIKVCDRWSTYENFYADMGDRPHGLTLDRRDNNGDYCPENCRWATKAEQAANRRTSILVEYNGEVMCAKHAAKLAGINPATLRWRIKQGWTGEKLFK